MITRASSESLLGLVLKKENKAPLTNHPNSKRRLSSKAVKPDLKKASVARGSVQVQTPGNLGLQDITYERNNGGIEMVYDGQVRYFKLTRPLQLSNFNPSLKGRDEIVPKGQQLKAVLKKELTFIRGRHHPQKDRKEIAIIDQYLESPYQFLVTTKGAGKREIYTALLMS